MWPALWSNGIDSIFTTCLRCHGFECWHEHTWIMNISFLIRNIMFLISKCHSLIKNIIHTISHHATIYLYNVMCIMYNIYNCYYRNHVSSSFGKTVSSACGAANTNQSTESTGTMTNLILFYSVSTINGHVPRN